MNLAGLNVERDGGDHFDEVSIGKTSLVFTEVCEKEPGADASV